MIFSCGGDRSAAGSNIATGPLTVSVVHYGEGHMSTGGQLGFISSSVQHNEGRRASISSYAYSEGGRICDSCQHRSLVGQPQ
jgi:hypothetical protein